VKESACNENDPPLRYCFYKRGQSIWHLTNTFDVIDIAVRRPVSLVVLFDWFPVLANLTILEPAHPEKLMAVFVNIGPCFDDAKPLVFFLEFDGRIFEKILLGAIWNVASVAAAVAVNVFLEDVSFQPFEDFSIASAGFALD
jgi:hypothetical protein